MGLVKCSDLRTIRKVLAWLVLAPFFMSSYSALATAGTIPWVQDTSLTLYLSSYQSFQNLDVPSVRSLWRAFRMDQQIDKRVFRWSIEKNLHTSLFERLFERPVILCWYGSMEGWNPLGQIEAFFHPDAFFSLLHNAMERGGVILPYFEGVEILFRGLYSQQLVTYRIGEFVGISFTAQGLQRIREQQIYRESFSPSTLLYGQTPLQVVDVRKQTGFLSVDLRSQPTGTHLPVSAQAVLDWMEHYGIASDQLQVHWFSPSYYLARYPAIFPEFSYDSEWNRMVRTILEKAEMVIHEDFPDQWIIHVNHPFPQEVMRPFFDSWSVPFDEDGEDQVICLRSAHPSLWIQVLEDRILFSNQNDRWDYHQEQSSSPRSPPSAGERDLWNAVFTDRRAVHYGVWFREISHIRISVPFAHTQESRIDRTVMRIQ